MSSEQGGILLTFHSVHDTIRAERRLKAEGLGPDLIPVPREISSDCGFCLFLRADGGKGMADASRMVPGAGLGCESIWRVFMEADEAEGRRRKRYERIETQDRCTGPRLPRAGDTDQEGP